MEVHFNANLKCSFLLNGKTFLGVYSLSALTLEGIGTWGGVQLKLLIWQFKAVRCLVDAWSLIPVPTQPPSNRGGRFVVFTFFLVQSIIVIVIILKLIPKSNNQKVKNTLKLGLTYQLVSYMWGIPVSWAVHNHRRNSSLVVVLLHLWLEYDS